MNVPTVVCGLFFASGLSLYCNDEYEFPADYSIVGPSLVV